MIGPTYDHASGIWRCHECDGYCRSFDHARLTCADEKCPGHATGGRRVEPADHAAAEAAP